MIKLMQHNIKYGQANSFKAIKIQGNVKRLVRIQYVCSLSPHLNEIKKRDTIDTFTPYIYYAFPLHTWCCCVILKFKLMSFIDETVHEIHLLLRVVIIFSSQETPGSGATVGLFATSTSYQNACNHLM